MPKEFKVHIKEHKTEQDLLVESARLLMRLREMDNIVNGDNPTYSYHQKENLKIIRNKVDEWVRENIIIEDKK